MNEATVKGLRELACSYAEPGAFALVDSKGHIVMGWLSRDLAEEFQKMYAGLSVIRMKGGGE